MYLEIITASFLIATVSLIGVLFFGKRGHLTGTHRYIVPFAIGTFLGITFFELIPVTLSADLFYGAAVILVGFFAFYTLSHFLHTYHHHHDVRQSVKEQPYSCEANKKSAFLLLVGDAVHNFADGVIIASTFITNPTAGWVVTAGIALHEAPQEVAQFGVLRRVGYTVRRALAYNFISASSVIVGAVTTLLVASLLSDFLWVVTGLAAGNLLYVAMSDLIPGLQSAVRADGYFLHSLFATIVGLIMIVAVIEWAHGTFDDHHDHDLSYQHHHEAHHETEAGHGSEYSTEHNVHDKHQHGHNGYEHHKQESDHSEEHD